MPSTPTAPSSSNISTVKRSHSEMDSDDEVLADISASSKRFASPIIDLYVGERKYHYTVHEAFLDQSRELKSLHELTAKKSKKGITLNLPQKDPKEIGRVIEYLYFNNLTLIATEPQTQLDEILSVWETATQFSVNSMKRQVVQRLHSLPLAEKVPALKFIKVIERMYEYDIDDELRIYFNNVAPAIVRKISSSDMHFLESMIEEGGSFATDLFSAYRRAFEVSSGPTKSPADIKSEGQAHLAKRSQMDAPNVMLIPMAAPSGPVDNRTAWDKQNNIPALWTTVRDTDKLVVSMAEAGTGWNTILEAVQQKTGERLNIATLLNRYNRLEANILRVASDDSNLLAAAQSEVETEFHESSKWPLVAARLIQKGGRGYEPMRLRYHCAALDAANQATVATSNTAVALAGPQTVQTKTEVVGGVRVDNTKAINVRKRRRGVQPASSRSSPAPRRPAQARNKAKPAQAQQAITVSNASGSENDMGTPREASPRLSPDRSKLISCRKFENGIASVRSTPATTVGSEGITQVASTAIKCNAANSHSEPIDVRASDEENLQKSMQSFLKDWRQDAMNKHQYDSAIFIGDKLLALTNDPNDAFWLAQVHFSTGNYSRALTFLDKHKLLDHSPSCRYLAAHCCVKQSKHEDALAILGDKTPGHLLGNANKSRRKLQHTGGYARNGVHRKGSSRTEKREQSEEEERESISNTKYEAAMCYLRGICFAKQNSYDRARECYMDAVRIDVQCFEAFDQLMKNCLLPPDEEWQFLESLDFDAITSSGTDTSQEAAQFTKMLYTTRLSKYKNPAEFSNAVESLSQHYKLDTNPDLLLSKAELLFTQCRFKQSLAITTSVLADDQYNFSFLPLHLACLYELHQPNTLFLLAHRLADSYPDEPATWLAVGVYYLSISQIAEARRFFSKASMMNPHFGPAWIGFAHTFALEGEHDQAVSAYGTAARLFQGTHLPQLFLGMQHLQLHNLTLAHEYLTTAMDLCNTDPLLLNEMGVVFYHLDHLPEAIAIFHRALAIADEIDSDATFWLATRANLGHAYRRQHQWALALGEFEEVLRQGTAPPSQIDSNSNNNTSTGKHNILAAKGLVLLEMGRTWDAIGSLHEALGVCPQDPVATDLLARALEENVGGVEGVGDFGDDERTEDLLDEAVEVKREAMKRKRSVRKRRGAIDAGNSRRARMSEGVEDSMMVMSEGEESG
ncbi:MAG: hypothetical protein Q9172_002713 [Xanthocarpia lactea]